MQRPVETQAPSISIELPPTAHVDSENEFLAYFKHQVDDQKYVHRVGTTAGVRQGWLHEDALGSIEDVDATLVQVVRAGTTAEAIDTSSQNYLITQEDLRDDIYGSQPVEVLRRTVQYAFNRIAFKGFEDQWINDAFTVHVAGVISQPHSKLAPSPTRSIQLPAAAMQRSMLYTLLRRGETEISIDQGMRAYSAKDSESKQEFLDAIDASWAQQRVGVSSLTEGIGQCILQRKTQLVQNGVDVHEAELRAVSHASRVLSVQPHAL